MKASSKLRGHVDISVLYGHISLEDVAQARLVQHQNKLCDDSHASM